jgi:hypothetical protein
VQRNRKAIAGKSMSLCCVISGISLCNRSLRNPCAIALQSLRDRWYRYATAAKSLSQLLRNRGTIGEQ